MPHIVQDNCQRTPLFQKTHAGLYNIAMTNGAFAPLFFINQNTGAHNAKPFGIKSIITSIGFREAVVAQFKNTLRSNVYIYVFGDETTDFVVSGIAFLDACWNDLCGGVIDTRAATFAGAIDDCDPSVFGQTTTVCSGTDALFELYAGYRASSLFAPQGRIGQPLLFRLHNLVFLAFMVGMRVEAQDPALNLFRFSIDFKVPPPSVF